MQSSCSFHHRRAFSLVELSIVLVILGLLVGGILSGQSLIRAAELRRVSTDIMKFQAAAKTFRDKYFAIPGDFKDATRFWGRLNGNADCVTNSAAAVSSPGTCDGDGDGIFSGGPIGVNVSVDTLQAWRQLALAGLIEGSYTGLSTTASYSTTQVAGSNVPASKAAGGAIWNLEYRTSGDAWNYNINYGNRNSTGNPSGAGVLAPSEMWNIDTKLDDGMPATGRIVAVLWSTCTTSTTMNDFSGSYLFSSSTANACILTLKDAF